LNNTDKATRRKIIYIVKNENKKREKVDYVLKAVQEHGGIDYTIQKMELYKKEAMDILYSFPKTEIRDGFEQMVNFVTDRKY
jgi:octaprenyl-diphosphate synthase